MSEDLAQLKRDYEAISTSGNTPGVRDLYPYIVSQKGLTEKDIPERKYLLGDWLPIDSFGMVYADRGVGKSWFCMALCVAVARGDKFFVGWEIYICMYAINHSAFNSDININRVARSSFSPSYRSRSISTYTRPCCF